MKRWTNSLAFLFIATIAFALCCDAVRAQDNPAPAPPPGGGPAATGGNGGNGGGGGGGRRGNFDPAQMRQRMTQFMKERLGATDDEWKAIEPLITKVIELQPRGGGMFGGGRRGPGGPGGGQNAQGGDQGAQGGQGGGQGGPGGPGRGMFGGQQIPEAEALQTVLDNKDSSPDQIKAATKAYRDALAKREKDLQKAREDLRGILSVRQEAQLVLMRILD